MQAIAGAVSQLFCTYFTQTSVIGKRLGVRTLYFVGYITKVFSLIISFIPSINHQLLRKEPNSGFLTLAKEMIP